MDGYRNRHRLPADRRRPAPLQPARSPASPTTAGLAVGLKNDLDQIPQLVGGLRLRGQRAVRQYDECDGAHPVHRGGQGGVPRRVRAADGATSARVPAPAAELAAEEVRTRGLARSLLRRTGPAIEDISATGRPAPSQPRASPTSAAVAAVSASAPNTSPVTPPNRRTQCRSSSSRRHQADHDRESRACNGVVRRRRAAPAPAHAATRPARPRPAPPAPEPCPPPPRPAPPGGPAVRPWRRARVSASRAVTAGDDRRERAVRPGLARTAWCSAATWASSTNSRVITPNGPMSDCFMIRSASSAGLPLPRPSAVSASPSRCSPRVRTAGTAAVATAASSGPDAEQQQQPAERRRAQPDDQPGERGAQHPAARRLTVPAGDADREHGQGAEGET